MSLCKKLSRMETITDIKSRVEQINVSALHGFFVFTEVGLDVFVI